MKQDTTYVTGKGSWGDSVGLGKPLHQMTVKERQEGRH